MLVEIHSFFQLGGITNQPRLFLLAKANIINCLTAACTGIGHSFEEHDQITCELKVQVVSKTSEFLPVTRDNFFSNIVEFILIGKYKKGNCIRRDLKFSKFHLVYIKIIWVDCNIVKTRWTLKEYWAYFFCLHKVVTRFSAFDKLVKWLRGNQYVFFDKLKAHIQAQC